MITTREELMELLDLTEVDMEHAAQVRDEYIRAWREQHPEEAEVNPTD